MCVICCSFHGVFRVLTCWVVSKINTESERLEREEEKAEEQMMAVQAALNEALNRLARLRRQKRALKSRGEEMVC